MYMFFSQYEYDLCSIASLIVSANRLVMCTCIIIDVLIYHDVIIQTLPSLSMCLDTHIGLIRPHFFKHIILFSFHLLGIVVFICKS